MEQNDDFNISDWIHDSPKPPDPFDAVDRDTHHVYSGSSSLPQSLDLPLSSRRGSSLGCPSGPPQPVSNSAATLTSMDVAGNQTSASLFPGTYSTSCQQEPASSQGSVNSNPNINRPVSGHDHDFSHGKSAQELSAEQQDPQPVFNTDAPKDDFSGIRDPHSLPAAAHNNVNGFVSTSNQSPQHFQGLPDGQNHHHTAIEEYLNSLGYIYMGGQPLPSDISRFLYDEYLYSGNFQRATPPSTNNVSLSFSDSVVQSMARDFLKPYGFHGDNKLPQRVAKRLAYKLLSQEGFIHNKHPVLPAQVLSSTTEAPTQPQESPAGNQSAMTAHSQDDALSGQNSMLPPLDATAFEGYQQDSMELTDIAIFSPELQSTGPGSALISCSTILTGAAAVAHQWPIDISRQELSGVNSSYDSFPADVFGQHSTPHGSSSGQVQRESAVFDTPSFPTPQKPTPQTPTHALFRTASYPPDQSAAPAPKQIPSNNFVYISPEQARDGISSPRRVSRPTGSATPGSASLNPSEIKARRSKTRKRDSSELSQQQGRGRARTSPGTTRDSTCLRCKAKRKKCVRTEAGKSCDSCMMAWTRCTDESEKLALAKSICYVLEETAWQVRRAIPDLYSRSERGIPTFIRESVSKTFELAHPLQRIGDHVIYMKNALKLPVEVEFGTTTEPIPMVPPVPILLACMVASVLKTIPEVQIPKELEQLPEKFNYSGKKEIKILSGKLPSTKALIEWSSSATKLRAELVPEDMESALQHFLQGYVEHKTPLPLFDLAKTVYEIGCLASFLDNRRPVLAKESQIQLNHILHGEHDPSYPLTSTESSYLPVEYFNDWKSSASMPAVIRQQLLLEATQAIEQRENIVMKIIDFYAKKPDTCREDVFILAACLERMRLYYRSNRERYSRLGIRDRCENNNTMTDLIARKMSLINYRHSCPLSASSDDVSASEKSDSPFSIKFNKQQRKAFEDDEDLLERFEKLEDAERQNLRESENNKRDQAWLKDRNIFKDERRKEVRCGYAKKTTNQAKAAAASSSPPVTVIQGPVNGAEYRRWIIGDPPPFGLPRPPPATATATTSSTSTGEGDLNWSICIRVMNDTHKEVGMLELCQRKA